MKDMENSEDIKDRIANCPIAETLLQHSSEFDKKVFKVTEGVHVAVGFALANSILLEAPEGLIVVDTTETQYAAAEVLRAFRAVSDRPIRAIIYTHSHEDHIGGAQTFVKDANNADLEIWAHEKFMDMATAMEHVLLRPAVLPRVIRQFGLGLSAMGVGAGIGPPMRGARLRMCWPNRLVRGDRQRVNIAGLELDLLHIPGETPCQMAVWVPSRGVLLPGDDFYRAFPNLYAIRGTSPRDVLTWARSLDVMRALGAEFLVPSHTRPVEGKEEVFRQLTCYRDAIQFVHDQTVRLMNMGMHPVEIAKAIRLPPSLASQPFLKPLYGTPEWSSRAVYDAYVGWFSGAVEELFPLGPTERAAKMMEYLGEEAVLSASEEALKKEDYQMALELSSYIHTTNQNHEKALKIRTDAILALASREVSANGRNYFLTCLAEEHGIHPRRYPTAHTIRSMPLRAVLTKLQYCLDPDSAAGRTITVSMRLRDVDEVYTLALRNCILEIEKGMSANATLSFTMSSDTLRTILTGESSVRELVDDISTSSRDMLEQFFSVFDFNDTSLSAKL